MADRKKILLTIDWFLPGTNSGGPVRSYANMLDHLGQYHDFLIITRNTDYCSEDVYPSIISNSWNQLNEHTSVYYFSKDQLTFTNFKALLKATDFDIIYINGIYSWYFSILPLWFFKNQNQLIVAARGMLNSQAFSVKKAKKVLFLRFANTFNLYKNVIFHATNQDEANQIAKRIAIYKKIKIAPNLPRTIQNDKGIRRKHSSVTHFVNIARISIEKGTLKMIQAFQHVKEPVKLDIYGQIYDEVYWKKCEGILETLPDHIQIQYKGVLPSDDVPKVLKLYDFFILLSEGENFGHAILEAMTAGCPVIISNNTPWKDLEEKKVGWDVPTQTQDHIIKTIHKASRMSDDDYEEWSANAVEFSRQFSQNPELIKLNLELFTSTE